MNLSKSRLNNFHECLHRWYAEHGRKDLPWRNTPDPYAIYISEIMLQQTQVKTVLERYYFQFLKRFPTLASLAKAKREEVLKAWQGLGYYNRAAHLHEVAKIRCQDSEARIQESKKSHFLNPESRILIPSEIDTLMSLPGIGRNTAHAIAAFAYHQPVAVMEANVKRVICRIFALENPGSEELWEKAGLLLDAREPFDYNQAMMDIGATICTKRAPACPACPAQNICRGKISPELYPAAKNKKSTPIRTKNIVLFRNRRGEYFAKPRTSRFLRGLYHFVEINIPSPNRGEARRGALLISSEQLSPHPNPPPNGEGKFLGHIRQQYSHFTLEADIFLLDVKTGAGKHWHSLAELRKLPFSMAEQKILQLLTPTGKKSAKILVA